MLPTRDKQYLREQAYLAAEKERLEFQEWMEWQEFTEKEQQEAKIVVIREINKESTIKENNEYIRD